MQTQNGVKKLRLRLSSTCRLNSELYKIYYKGCALATKKTEGKIGTVHFGFWQRLLGYIQTGIEK